MNRTGFVHYALLLLILIASAVDVVAKEVPYLSGRVNDHAQLIEEGATSHIAQRLKQLESSTGAQVAILTITSLEDDSLEDFSMRVVETWKLGRQGRDDGILILVVKDERKIRIEVGYGLEGALTDLDSRRVIEHLMVPPFREGNYEQGIQAAVEAIAGAIEGNPEAIPEAPGDQPDIVILVIFLGVFLLFISPFAYFAIALPGSGGWFMYVFLIPFFLLFPMVAGGTVAAVVGGLWAVLGAILRIIWPDKWRIKSEGDGFTGGWKSSGSGWSSSSSGGGFSGGGGSFGGGGASGSW